MSFYFFNRYELLQQAKDKYHNGGGKGKAIEYYILNKEVLLENAKNMYRNLSEEEEKAKREYGRNGYRNMTEDEKNKLKEYQRKYQAANKINIIFLYNIKMSEKTLKFDKC